MVQIVIEVQGIEDYSEYYEHSRTLFANRLVELREADTLAYHLQKSIDVACINLSEQGINGELFIHIYHVLHWEEQSWLPSKSIHAAGTLRDVRDRLKKPP